MQEKYPLVSIVIPVRNEERYLRECLDSVLVQTYENIEIVISDNCSSDNSREIIEDYAGRDVRIRFFLDTEEAPNVYYSMNRALTRISDDSKYCKIVFGDDWIFPECVEKMVAKAETDPDIKIVSAYIMLQDNVWLFGLPYSQSIYEGSDICRLLMEKRQYYFGNPNSVLFRVDQDMRRGCFYEINVAYGDANKCTDLLKNGKFGFVHQVLTFTRRENQSTISDMEQHGFFDLYVFTTLVRYGKYFYPAEDFEKLFRRVEKSYLRVFVRGLLKGREKYWDFHSEQWQLAGYNLSKTRLVWASIYNILYDLGSPRDIVAKLTHGIRHRGKS